MTRQSGRAAGPGLAAALAAPDPSVRLQVALAAGTHPDPAFIDVLAGRCAVEQDFFVRDMLTWALTRHERKAVTGRVLRELSSPSAQARSQALHTLSKIGDRQTWPAITVALLQDEDEDVARAAWRAAVGLVPEEEAAALAQTLATQLGRGAREVQLSLSRAFVALDPAGEGALAQARRSPDPQVRAHAIATGHLIQNPEEGFDAGVEEARRALALRGAPKLGE